MKKNLNKIDYKKEMIKYAQFNLNETSDSFSKIKWDQFSNFGWFGLNVSDHYGGLNQPHSVCANVIMELGYYCNDNGFTFTIVNHWWMVIYLIELFGNKTIKENYLNDLITGKKIGAFALTEPDAGSDSKSIKTYVKEDNGFILNGNKSFVTNGSIADVFIVFAKYNSEIKCFVVEKNTKGLVVSKKIEKMGLDSNPTCDIYFENCLIPKDNMLGNNYDGYQIMLSALSIERFYEFVPIVGIMKRIMQKCINYSQERKQFGKSISSNQAISFKISNMAMVIELAEQYIKKISNKLDNNENIFLEASVFKLFVSENYVKLCKDAIQIFGGYGYSKEYGLERELRDSIASTIYSGTSEIQRQTIFDLISIL